MVFLENELLYGTEFPVSAKALDKNWTVPIGKAKCELQGDDLTIVTFSKCVGVSLEAAKELAAAGINCEVINLRTLRPLDRNAIAESVKKTGRLMTVEEGWPAVRAPSHARRHPEALSLSFAQALPLHPTKTRLEPSEPELKTRRFLRKGPTGVPGSAWRFTGCLQSGSSTYPQSP